MATLVKIERGHLSRSNPGPASDLRLREVSRFPRDGSAHAEDSSPCTGDRRGSGEELVSGLVIRIVTKSQVDACPTRILSAAHYGEDGICECNAEQWDGPPRSARVVFRCPECNQVWTADDDPNEWAYGHDCES